MQVEDASQEDESPSTIHRGSPMMSNWLLEEGRKPMKQKEGSTAKKLLQDIEAKRQVKRIVKQKKRNKELNMQEFVNNTKSFYSYVNEIRIVRDNIGPLKTLDRTVISTDNDMANTLNNYFRSVFTIQQLNTVPQLGQYEGNINEQLLV